MANGKLSLPVATLTKTKLNIQQTALVGIAAVATAALLGAFTAQFASAIAGVRIAATTISCTNPANLACGKPVTSVAPPTSYWQKAYTPERVTDGNRTTYSTTSDWKMGYEIDLKQSTEVTKLVITWGRWGFSGLSSISAASRSPWGLVRSACSTLSVRRAFAWQRVSRPASMSSREPSSRLRC